MTGAYLGGWIEKVGDRLNPILVKETRQALKSRQFVGTFTLLLVASLLVSFGGVALAGPDLDYRSMGSTFFVAYFAVLAFAVFIVVPFGAYRSLAAEQEERTYELLSITTLRPGQIITGKLLSSMIQMFIYFSAIAPFMAFTYLLKGIDILAILFVLVLALFGSVGFSMCGLFLATFSSRRAWQVFLSVVMISGLGIATIFSVFLAMLILQELGGPFFDPSFYVAMTVLLTFYLTGFALMFQLSLSQLTFESDNRSSKVRLVILVQFATGIAWIAWAWIMELEGDRIFLEVMSAAACIYWGIIGACLIAEPLGISRRVARQIPRFGPVRTLALLLFPGPATGLALVLVGLATIPTLVGLAELTETWAVVNYRATGTRGEAAAMAIGMASYAFFYVGLGAILVRFMRRFRLVPLPAGAATTVILAALGSLIPNFFVLAMRQGRYMTYDIWQITDPFTTVAEIGNASHIFSPLLCVPLGMAILVLVLNLRVMACAVHEVDRLGSRRQVASAVAVRTLQEIDAAS